MTTLTLTKHCPRGRHDVPRSQFAKNAMKRDGLTTWCKACTRDYSQSLDREPRNPLEQLRKQLGLPVTFARGIAVKVCRGCQKTLPLTKGFYRLRVRTGHNPHWDPFCRECKRLRLDRKTEVAL